MSVVDDMAKEELKMDMTPMIDVVFQLIIFFMCNIKYKTLEGRLDAFLPKDVGVNSAPATQPPEKVEVVIKVVEPGERRDPRNQNQPWIGEGRYELVDRKLTYQIGPRKTGDLEEVKKVVAQLHREDPERKSTIDCRPGTVYADMIPVLDHLVDAGFSDITFVGEYKTAKK
ncbi:MAG: biopolymer transporter ExbD [Planctomycetota bacterium]